MLVFVSLLKDGLLPDFQAEIKAQFKPKPKSNKGFKLKK